MKTVVLIITINGPNVTTAGIFVHANAGMKADSPGRSVAMVAGCVRLPVLSMPLLCPEFLRRNGPLFSKVRPTSCTCRADVMEQGRGLALVF